MDCSHGWNPLNKNAGCASDFNPDIGRLCAKVLGLWFGAAEGHPSPTCRVRGRE